MGPDEDIGASEVPPAALCVLRYILERRARDVPDREFVRFWRGETWSYAATLGRVRRRAAVLRRHGVRQGDRVLCWTGNGPELLLNWFAINYLGAVYVPLNTAARGRPLAHMLENAEAWLMLAHPALVGNLAGIARGALRMVLVPGAPATALPAVAGLTIAGLEEPSEAADDPIALERPIEPWDVQAIMYTSGTTGRAKGVLFSYAQHWTMGPEAMTAMTAGDCCLIAGPIFHCGSTLYVYAMLAAGGTIAMIPEFRTADFWPAVRDTGSTVVLLLGVMAGFLLKAPAAADDRDHTLRKAYIVPFGDDARLFRDRFGVELHTVYNMTEISSPLVAGPGIEEPGLAGRPRPPFELRVVDAHDVALPPGSVGELVVRSHRPWALFSGYHRDPEATVAATRNGWFHTGDAFRVDVAGRFFFVDRLKDVIRRRGENISSFELEAEIVAHPQIREAVAVAVPAELGEDEVLVAVTVTEGERLDPAELVAFLAGRVAHYMIPRYVRIVDALPKTASGKLQKHELRAAGITADTWDRDAAGVRLARPRLE